AIQREVLCRVGTAGTGQRPDLAGKSHKCVKSALAEEKRRQEKRRGPFMRPALGGGQLTFAVAAARFTARFTLTFLAGFFTKKRDAIWSTLIIKIRRKYEIQ